MPTAGNVSGTVTGGGYRGPYASILNWIGQYHGDNDVTGYSVPGNMPNWGSSSYVTNPNYDEHWFNPVTSGVGNMPGTNGPLRNYTWEGGLTSGGIDTSLIPGFSELGQYDFNQLQQMLFGPGSQGGGGGGGGGINIGNAQSFLDNLFTGVGNIGNLDPTLLGNIYGLQGDAGQNYTAFGNTLSGLGQQYLGEIGGNDLISALLGDVGSGGGRGGFGGGFSFQAGGGIPQSSIADLLKQLPEFQAREIRTGLPELDGRLASELDIIKQSQLADFDQFRQDQNAELLTNLFGRGVQQSTVAGEAADRANRSLENTRLDILSEDVARRLGIRKEEADRILAGDLGSLQAEAGAYGDKLRSLTGIRTSEIGAAAQASAAASAAGASAAGAQAALQGDRLRALASIYGSRTGALADLFGSQVGGLTQGLGIQQGAITDFAGLFGNLALGNQQADIERYLGVGNLASGVLNTEAQRRVASANARNSASSAWRNDFLNFLGFQEDVAGRFQSGLMGQGGWDLQRELAQLQSDTSRYNARRGQQDSSSSSWANALGAIAQVAAAYYGG